MKFFLLLSYILSSFLFSCNSIDSKNEKSKKTKVTSRDETDRLRYKALGIDYLKDYPNLQEVQIWIDPGGLKDSGQIIIFKKINNLWYSELHKYAFIAIKESLEKKLIFHEKQELNLSVTQDSFSTKIEAISFLSLSDSLYKKYDCSHGETICVEVLKNKNYSKILFPCWTSIKNDSLLNLTKQFIVDAERDFNINLISNSNISN